MNGSKYCSVRLTPQYISVINVLNIDWFDVGTFMTETIKYLEHVISFKGILPDPEKKFSREKFPVRKRSPWIYRICWIL